jgi:flagellar basal body-associated protein FliL
MRRRLLTGFFILCAALAPARGAEHGAKAEKKEPEKKEEKKGDKDKAPEHKITQSESYVMLDPIYTTIVADNRPTGLMMIGIGLDIPDAAMREDVEHSLPVLRDAYVRNLLAFTVAAVRVDTQPDVGVIANRLQAVTDRALKKKGAKVLIAQLALRAK